jgi:hypothetical protein
VPAPDAAPTAVASETFDVPAHEVWAFRLDFMNLPRYNPDVSGVSRLTDGEGVGGMCGPGARYGFELADPRRPGTTHPVELWIEATVEPTLVSAAMRGGNEAYEDFTVRSTSEGASEATLTLWVSLPEGLPEATHEAAVAGSLAQITKELTLMKAVLEERSEATSVH